MPFRPARLNAFEEAVAARAERYVATAFRGRATYDRREAATLEGALAAAPTLFEDRPIAIYAVATNGASAMIGSWEPDRR